MFPSSYSNILPDHHTCGDNEMFVTNYYNENPNYLSSPDELVAPNLANSKDHEEVIDEEDGLILSELLSHKTERCSEVISYCNINNKEKEKVVSDVTTNSSKRKKGRHSKICTAQGTRDRRMRLSLQIARKFFDLQDMLGFDKASQTIEWLFSKSKSAIKDLKDSFSPPGAPKNIQVDDDRQKGEQSVLLKEEKILRKSSRKVVKESRDKARERARERTREKLKAKMVIEQQPHLQAANNHDQLLEDDGILRMKEQFLGILRAERSFLEQNGANSEDDFLGFSQNSDFLHNYSSSSCFCCPAETNVKQPSQLNVEVQNPNSIFLDTSSSRSDEQKNDTPNFSNNNTIPFYSQTQNPTPFFMNTASYNSTSAQHQNPNSSFIPSSLIGQQKQNMSTNSSSNLLLTSPSSVYLESQFIEDQFHCNYASANY